MRRGTASENAILEPTGGASYEVGERDGEPARMPKMLPLFCALTLQGPAQMRIRTRLPPRILLAWSQGSFAITIPPQYYLYRSKSVGCFPSLKEASAGLRKSKEGRRTGRATSPPAGALFIALCADENFLAVCGFISR